MLAAAALAAVVWIANTWSPSSYGIVLRSLGVRDTGLVLGEPRAIRSDEWGILTPLTQATVNNGLRRFNETSFYHEDLRAFLSFPIADWGLAFKPDQWLFPFVNAAYAFSFKHLVYIAAFLAGYAWLFVRSGIAAGPAALLSGALFFTAFVQFWWTTYAPDIAFFPWLILCLGIRHVGVRAVAFFWVAVVWMLGCFYPPLFIPLAVVAAAFYWSLYYSGRALKDVAIDGVVALAACGVVAFYLQDYFAATWDSIYPGQRRTHGGNVPLSMQLQTLWPTSYLVGFESTIPKRNVCESSVVGTYYFLLAACFVDFRRLVTQSVPSTTRRVLIAALAGFVVLFLWQNVPIPASIGRWLLFDRVQPVRTLFASGFLLLLAAAHVVEIGALRFSVPRLVAFCLAILLGWSVTKWAAQPVPALEWTDAAVFPVALAVMIAGSRFRGSGPAAIAAGSAILGLLAFGAFNPIQSAWPIFNRESTPITKALDTSQAQNPLGVLVSDQFGGTLIGWGYAATLNGLGYRSAAHSLLAPQPALWRELFPEMTEPARNAVFNRIADIVIRDVDEPQLLWINVVAVPRRVFRDVADPWFTTGPLSDAAGWTVRSGHLDTRRAEGRTLLLAGWGPWRGLVPGQTLSLLADVPLTIVSAKRVERPDVARVLKDERFQYSGYVVEVAATGNEPLPADLAVCLIAGDGPELTTALIEPGGPGCGSASR